MSQSQTLKTTESWIRLNANKKLAYRNCVLNVGGNLQFNSYFAPQSGEQDLAFALHRFKIMMSNCLGSSASA